MRLRPISLLDACLYLVRRAPFALAERTPRKSVNRMRTRAVVGFLVTGAVLLPASTKAQADPLRGGAFELGVIEIGWSF